MRSFSRHSPAAYIASLSSSGVSTSSQPHLTQAVEAFNSLALSSEAVCLEDGLTSPIFQKVLSNKVDSHQFNTAMKNSSKARLLLSPPHMHGFLLSWVCDPMVVGSIWCLGDWSHESLSCLASRPETSSNKTKAVVLTNLY